MIWRRVIGFWVEHAFEGCYPTYYSLRRWDGLKYDWPTGRTIHATEVGPEWMRS